jgi:hypothetical protein
MAHLEQAAVREAEQGSGLSGKPAHRLLQRHLAQLARPVAHQVQAEGRVIEEGEVRAGVRQAHQGVGVVEHAAHRVLVRIEHRGGEHGVEVLGNGQVEHEVERIGAGLAREFGDAALLVARMFRGGHLDHLNLVPLAVEEAKHGGCRDLGAHRVTKILVRDGHLNASPFKPSTRFQDSSPSTG